MFGSKPVVDYTIPRQIIRPLHLPVLKPGESCPRSSASAVDLAAFGGISLGAVGPVHPIIGEVGARQANPIAASAEGGLYGVKTLWYSRASYQGPVLIRGQRLDAPGTITFGESPQLGFLVDGGIPNGTRGVGVRSWPGGTFVARAGCYGFQVDGTSFSYLIIMSIRVPGSD